MNGYPTFKTLNDTLTFQVQYHGNLFLATISGEVLWSHFGGGLDDAGLMSAYFANEQEIHGVAIARIQAGDLNPALTMKDFTSGREADDVLRRASVKSLGPKLFQQAAPATDASAQTRQLLGLIGARAALR